MICLKFQIICIPRFQIIQVLNVLKILQTKQRLSTGYLLMTCDCMFTAHVMTSRTVLAYKRGFAFFLFTGTDFYALVIYFCFETKVVQLPC